jgi:hypothetical protein
MVIHYKMPFCTIEFFRLETAATMSYCGEYQDQSGISANGLQNLVEAQGMTFGQIITSLQELSQNVKSLSDSVLFLKLSFPAMLAFAMAVIAVLIAFVK